MTKHDLRTAASQMMAEALAKGLTITKVPAKQRMTDIRRRTFIRRAAEFREVRFNAEAK